MTVLQQDLYKLYNWCTDNGMTFNATKSKVMHVTRKRNLQLPVYMLGHSQLSITSSFKYLGVTLNSQLTWNDHVKNVVSRANRMFGLIRTVAFNSSVCAKLCLYKSLVLPVLEYGIPAWFPQTGYRRRLLNVFRGVRLDLSWVSGLEKCLTPTDFVL